MANLFPELDYKDYVITTDSNGNKKYVRDVQVLLLEILKDIDKVCQSNNIPYFLTGGSCLGAVRHDGFIPWDDDADIGMMYDDYCKFLEIAQKELGDNYSVQSYESHPKYMIGIPSMKVKLKGTWCKEVNPLMANRCEDGDGIFIDVFVIDYLSEDNTKEKRMRRKANTLCYISTLLQNIGINSKSIKNKFNTLVRNYSNECKKENSKLIGYDLSWCFSPINKPTKYPIDSIYPVKYVKFEDTMLPIPNEPIHLLNSEIALSHMSLPPEKDRVAKHFKDFKDMR